VFEVLCQYPEADLEGHIYFKNHTILSNIERLGEATNGYVSYSGPENITLIDIYSIAPMSIFAF